MSTLTSHVSGRRPTPWVRTRIAAFRSSLLLVVAAVSAVGVIVATGTQPRPVGPGIRDSGVLTTWLVPVLRVLLDLSAVGCVGGLVAAALLVDSGEARRRMLRVAHRWALGWAVTALAGALVSSAVLLGLPLSLSVRSSADYRLILSIPQGRALLFVAVVAGVVAWWARRTSTVTAARGLLALSLLAMAPLLQTGHAAAAGNHYLAGQSLLLHVLAATVWVGGLAMTVLHLRGAALVEVLPRFSVVALVCFVVVALSGLVGAWLRLGADPASWGSTYGVLVGAKVASLALLGAAGWWHRRWILPAVAAGRRHAFVRLAVAETALMAATFGLAVALARTPLPDAAASRVTPPHAVTFATVDRSLPAISPRSLALETRPDAVVVTVLAAVAASGAILLARGRARRAPGGIARVAGGLLLVAWCLCGGLAAYSAALPSAQVAQILLLGTVAPWLVLGGLAALLPPASRLREWGSPVPGLLGLLVVLSVLPSPLLELALRSALLHGLLAVAALTTGALMLTPIMLGPWRADRGDDTTILCVLSVVLVCHAALVLEGGAPVGRAWFARLDWVWLDLAADQRLAGLLLGAAGLVVAVAAVALTRVRRRASTIT